MSETVIEPVVQVTPGAADTGAAGAPDNTGAVGAAGAPSVSGKAADTVLGSEPADKVVTAPADWPTDWREKMAGEDTKFLASLKRYTSPLTFAKAGNEAQRKIQAGETKKPLSLEATPEELATFRAENGIPAKAEEYEIKLSDGMIPGTADKPVLDDFKKFAHDKNWAPDALNEVLNFYYKQQDKTSVLQYESDTIGKTATEETLRAEWGADYRMNVNAMNNFLGGAPQGVASDLINGRAPDGSILGNNPGLLRWLSSVAREAMPGSGLMPSGTSNPAAAMTTEIETIQRTMRDEPNKYWGDPKMQSRFRDLLDAQTRSSGRAA